MELSNWVKDDIREQLKSRIITYPNLVRKAKTLKVNFRTSYMGLPSSDSMNFYMHGDIYFDSDDAIKRQRLLDKLGIT
jgi:hypothetical protein